MGPPSYLRSVVDRNVVMGRMTLYSTAQKSTITSSLQRKPFGAGIIFLILAHPVYTM